jgi:DNA-binding response OmpR family regulator
LAKKILIIEDYEATAKMIADILAMKGYESIIAYNGNDGYEKALTEKPDLILLDIMMPGINGLEVCKQLKSNPETKNTPVIIVSVKSSREDIAAGKEKGAEDYIPKPFEPFELLEAVNKYLK